MLIILNYSKASIIGDIYLKLRLVFKTKSKRNKVVTLKINIAPSKHLGFINFVNLALNQNKPVSLSLEKIGDSGEKERIGVESSFEFQSKEV
jgi:hypothetical protein